jgi:hypothetical protein
MYQTTARTNHRRLSDRDVQVANVLATDRLKKLVNLKPTTHSNNFPFDDWKCSS